MGRDVSRSVGEIGEEYRLKWFFVQDFQEYVCRRGMISATRYLGEMERLWNE